MKSSKLNKAIIIIAKIVEIFMWVGCGISLCMLIACAVGHPELIGPQAGDTVLTTSNFSIHTHDVNGAVIPGSYVLLFITVIFTLTLMGMVARNVYLIFKTTEGETSFSKGKTPFQPDNIRMVREIGIFLIAIPVVELIMSAIAGAIIGIENVESNLNFVMIFVGLIPLALSQYFAYGMQLQNEVDGMI